MRIFSEGFHYPKGPLKALTEEDKEKVHLLAEIKLDELEEANLSKEEILAPESGKVGLKLSEDPFFQYIKSNRLAREILIKPNELFTPDKIVNLALRQDIGIDNASSMTNKKRTSRDELSWVDAFNLENSPKQHEEMLEPQAYFSHERGIDWQDYRERDYIHVKVPLNKGIIRNNDIEEINLMDLHWRNTALLTQFVNSCCFIQTPVQNRLPQIQQKKVAKVIKHARQMKLLPYRSYIRAHHKISLRSLEEDIQDSMRRKVDLELGSLVVEEPKTEWETYEEEDFEEEAQKFDQYNFK